MEITQVINGIPLVAVVIGLVEWVKVFEVPPKWLNLVSMAIGLLVGLGYWYAQSPLSTFADWFGAGIYGIALGLIASGLYKAGVNIARKE